METFLAYYLLEKLFLRRSLPPWLWMGAFAVFGLGLGLMSLLSVLPIGRLLYTFCGVLLLCRCCFFSSLLHAVYVSVLFCAMFLFTDILCYWLLVLLGWDPARILSAGGERVIYIVMAKLVQLGLTMLAPLLLRREQVLLKLRSIVPLLLCQVFSLYVCDHILHFVERSGTEILSGSFLLSIMGILYVNLIIVYYAEVIKARQEERHEAELREQQLNLQLSYYKSMQSQQERTRALYHDMDKHLSAVEALMEGQNKSSADRLLQELRNSLQEAGSLVDVGNVELSAILNPYVQLCRESEIPLSLSVWVPPTLPISPMDLNTLVGNSFENAIEASLPLPPEQRRISLSMSLHNESLLLYEISNACLPGRKIRLGRDRGCHGCGTQNLRKIASAYHGNLRIAHTGQNFTLSAYLNLR